MKQIKSSYVSIRFLLFASFLLLTIVLILTISLLSWTISQKVVRSHVQESFSLTLDYVSAGIRGKLEDIYDLSDYIFTNGTIRSAIIRGGSDSPESSQATRDASEALSSLTLSEFYENINRITITGFNGFYLRSLMNYYDYPEDGLSQYYEEWTRQALQTGGQPLWSGVITRKLNPQHPSSVEIREAVLFRVIKNLRYTEEIGMFYISVNDRLFRSQLQDYHSSYPDYADCSLYVVDASGETIGAEPCPLSREELELCLTADPAKVSAGVQSGETDSTIFVKEITGGWRLIALLPDSLYVPSNEFVSMSLVIFPICILICCAIWLYLSSGIFRPLQAISNTMRRIADGEQDLRINVTANNEMGRLSRDLNHMLERIDQLNRENRDKEIKALDAMYRAKQAQINPHFIYNTLNSIRWMSVMAGVPNIQSAIDAFWIIEKYHTGSSEMFSTVKEEVYIVKQYVFLQKLSYGNRFDVEWDVTPAAEQCHCIKFFIQPLVENAIKHGALPKNGLCTIRISLYVEADRLVFNIYDDGAGMDEKTLARIRGKQEDSPAGGHVGLLNVLERLRYAYADAYSVDISSLEGAFTNIMIQTPLQHASRLDSGQEGTTDDNHTNRGG